jgi:trehalose 6-phosphate synthase
MRLSLRFIIPLAVALGAIAYGVVPLVDELTLRWFVRDLDIRGKLIANAVQEPLIELLTDKVRDKVRLQRVQAFFTRMLEDERVFALGFCDANGVFVYRSATLPADIGCGPKQSVPEETGRVIGNRKGLLHVAATPIVSEGHRFGELLVVHDMSFIERRSADTKKYIVWLFASIGAVIALITVVIAELSFRGWMSGIKALIRGQSLALSPEPKARELRPIARDLEAMVQELEAERRMRDESQISWTPQALRTILREDLKGDEILIVSNREPYIHVRHDGRLEVQRPASGLVTALEPVMRACSGTWVAHGSGSGDREAADAQDHVMVPPEKPAYRIRRVWLSKEEEAGYYYGFANEGLWPLCHIAHTRPVFRAADWAYYRTVNRRFALAVEKESRTDNPIVLVHDYHFALLPRMIRERMPNATIITFWHIPWPNPEAFGVCPWRVELLEGLLGSSIVGFHAQIHCNNFVDTVDRTLEARIDRETFGIHYGGELTEVRRYPISIEWPPLPLAAQAPVAECRSRVRDALGVAQEMKLGIGVDRLDYTKGILERFAAIERLLELEPRWIGRFAFVQIAAPSRSSIEEYQSLDARVRAAAQRINGRFGAPRRRPGLRLLPCRRPVLRLEPARRHEPGRQGVRRCARGRARRPDPFAVHRRRARAVRSADRESVRHRAMRRGVAPGAHHAARRAAQPDAQHARPGPGVQCLPLGGPDAARCGAHAQPAPARSEQARARAGRAAASMTVPGVPPFGPNWAFFLDIDGTLLEYAEHPQRVRVEGSLLALLDSLRAETSGALALISGRSVEDIDTLFAPLALPVAGQHGSERRGADGRVHRHAPQIEKLGRAAAAIVQLTAAHSGLVFENKGMTLALHYRLAPQLRVLVEREMRAIAAALGDGFELQSGKFVAEIKPSGKDKGSAIAEFGSEPPFAGRQPVFVGDDLTDEPGFEIVNRIGGHSVKVGRGITRARWRLVDAAAVRRWLTAYVEHFAEHRAALRG